MKQLFAIVSILSCSFRFLLAEDLTTHAREFLDDRYLILALSESQLAEVESKRTVTLTKAQLQELRAQAPAFPKRIGVASPFVAQIAESRFSLWPEQINGVWFCKDRVAIPRDSLNGVEGFREFSKQLNAGDAVLIDTKAGYWVGPRPVDRAMLIESLDMLAAKAPAGVEFEVFILRPPVLNPSGEEQAVEVAVNDLIALCAERGLAYRVGG
ncbi:MAG: hypothetical protein MUE94_00365 [Verrucomicrobia bacterium]|jgi:hypothetical protein|nr:hypothetical protein [Verrucomicrobiota bacterium]